MIRCQGFGYLKYEKDLIKVICLSGNKITSESFDTVDPDRVFIYWSCEIEDLINFIKTGTSVGIYDENNNLSYEELRNYEPCPMNLVFNEETNKNIITIGYQDDNK